MLAVGCATICSLTPGRTFDSLQQFHNARRDWLMGYFSYDLKNESEALLSRNPDYLQFAPAYFYVPQHLIHFEAQQIVVESFTEPETIYSQINVTAPATEKPVFPAISVRQRTSQADYVRTVARIREHLLDGDVYELNYCVEFFAENVRLDPLATYLSLNRHSPMPFSAYQRIGDHYLLGASPERFLKKTGNYLISQPIKGTARRGRNAAEDAEIMQKLRTDEKELAENMMIVDLVRNDLARSAQVGSVKVEELFGVYTFAQLHQMISTVSAQLKPGLPFTTAIQNAFPMGSMTGAPKVRAMERIDQYENTQRGLYSGAVGYITPEGNFDFNVVIRSILYNAATQYLSFQVGSAITYDAVAENEYAECLLKAQSMLDVLGATL